MKYNINLLKVSPFRQNCRIISNEDKEAIIIDPGYDADKIINTIESNYLIPKAILITHGHIDHIGQVHIIKDKYNIPSIGPHIADKPLISYIKQKGIDYGIDNVANNYPDQYVNDEQDLNIIGLKIKCFLTPGHSPGHIVFYLENLNTLLSGDLLFKGTIGTTDLPFASFDEILVSLNKVVNKFNDECLVLSGHGHDTTIGEEKLNNEFIAEAIKRHG